MLACKLRTQGSLEDLARKHRGRPLAAASGEGVPTPVAQPPRGMRVLRSGELDYGSTWRRAAMLRGTSISECDAVEGDVLRTPPVACMWWASSGKCGMVVDAGV